MTLCDAHLAGWGFRQTPVSVDPFHAVAPPVFLTFWFLRRVRAIRSPFSVVMIFLSGLGGLSGALIPGSYWTVTRTL
jgi:hypothetical protein